MKRLRWLWWLGGRERGVTLIELLVAIPIAGLVAAAAAGTIIQLMNTNDISAGMLAVRQVQTAGDWVSRDGVQAQSDNDTISDNISTGSGMPFTLIWSYWDKGVNPVSFETHEVKYFLDPSGSVNRLRREEVINGVKTTMTVAEYVTGATCAWEPGSKTTFIFTVTAVVGGKTESRSYQVMPRAWTG